jgi:hypothetical protein
MKDKVPQEYWDKPLIMSFSRAIALAWVTALTVMTAAALVRGAAVTCKDRGPSLLRHYIHPDHSA